MTRSFLTGAALGAILLTAPQLAQAAPTTLVGLPAATQAVNFAVHFPLRNEPQLNDLIRMQSDAGSPLYHHFLSVAQFRANYGATPDTLARAAAALRARGFAITKQTSQSLWVSGAAASVEKAFGTKLGFVREGTKSASRVASTTPMAMPAELTAFGATVTGFEPRVHVHLNTHQVPLNRNGAFGGYWFDDLKEAYSYPSDRSLDGKGATVGVLMSSDVRDSDTAAYFDHEKYASISKKTRPNLIRETIFGGGGVDGPAFDEASIDVQTSSGSAPGAQIVLYNIPDLSDQSIIAGYTQAVEQNGVDVLSSSFGGCELGYTAAYNLGQDFTGILKSYHELFLQGNAQGITFLASSGDEAGLECPNVAYWVFGNPGKFVPSVSWPADDPNVTAVGGTNLETTKPAKPQPLLGLPSKYVAENSVGNAEVPYDYLGIGATVSGGFWGSGGGSSVLFAKPDYQTLIPTGSKTRSVPDISMQMGGCPGLISVKPCPANANYPRSYSKYYVDGIQSGFIGTSLSSPEFAGLLALKVQLGQSRLGNANYYIYRLAANLGSSGKKYYHQGIPGYNGVVTTKAGKAGYDPIVGVGTPYTQNFLGLPAVSLAGDPQTFSNP